MKKFFIILNLILTGLLVFWIIILHTEMKAGEITRHNLEKYNFAQLTRPSARMSGDWAPAFGLKSLDRPGAAVKIPGRDGKNRDNSTGLNQLITNNEIIRVTGIFTTQNQQSAAIEVIPKNKIKRNTVKKMQRIVPGDMLKGYRVMSIEPDSIVLSQPSAENVRLKIFAQ